MYLTHAAQLQNCSHTVKWGAFLCFLSAPKHQRSGNGKPHNARSSEGDSIKMQYLSQNSQRTTFQPLPITYFYSLRSHWTVEEESVFWKVKEASITQWRVGILYSDDDSIGEIGGAKGISRAGTASTAFLSAHMRSPLCCPHATSTPLHSPPSVCNAGKFVLVY